MFPSGSSTSAERLTQFNYESWKTHIKSVLINHDLWPYVEGSEVKPDVDSQKWLKNDSKALAMINSSVSPDLLNHTKNAETSKQAWDALKHVFESTGPNRVFTLYKQLLRMKKDSSTSISQYINEFSAKAEQLGEAGLLIPEKFLSVMILNSLPAEFESFCIAIEAQDNIPTLASLKAKLQEMEERQKDREAKKTMSATFSPGKPRYIMKFSDNVIKFASHEISEAVMDDILSSEATDILELEDELWEMAPEEAEELGAAILNMDLNREPTKAQLLEQINRYTSRRWGGHFIEEEMGVRYVEPTMDGPPTKCADTME